mgnify:CR=1 FL=1
MTLGVDGAVEASEACNLGSHGLVLLGDDGGSGELGVHVGAGSLKLLIAALDLLDAVHGLVSLDNGEHAVLSGLGGADAEAVKGLLGVVLAVEGLGGFAPLFLLSGAEFDEESVVSFGECPNFISGANHLLLKRAITSNVSK